MHVQATRRFGRRIAAGSGRWRGQRAIGIIGPLRFRLSRRIAFDIDPAARGQSGARQLSAIKSSDRHCREPTRSGDGTAGNQTGRLLDEPLAATGTGRATARRYRSARTDAADSVSPLSPQVPPPAASSGGSARQGSLALSPGSETNPSAPGGGGKTLADCMGFWEPATHMTKQEWRGACQRTIGRLGR